MGIAEKQVKNRFSLLFILTHMWVTNEAHGPAHGSGLAAERPVEAMRQLRASHPHPHGPSCGRQVLKLFLLFSFANVTAHGRNVSDMNTTGFK